MIESDMPMHFPVIRLTLATLIVLTSLGVGGCAGGGAGPNSMVAIQLSAADEQLADNVQAALHADPYLYDKHIEVSIEHGDVALRGFVSNYEDLINAKKIAIKAASGRRVVDYLSIKPIEEQNTGPRR
jgi:osmotically-inducible protein OsmY